MVRAGSNAKGNSGATGRLPLIQRQNTALRLVPPPLPEFVNLLVTSKALAGIEYWRQGHKSPVDHDFSLIREVDCNPPADVRLNLPCAPLGLIRVSDKHTRLENGI